MGIKGKFLHGQRRNNSACWGKAAMRQNWFSTRRELFFFFNIPLQRKSQYSQRGAAASICNVLLGCLSFFDACCCDTPPNPQPPPTTTTSSPRHKEENHKVQLTQSWLIMVRSFSLHIFLIATLPWRCLKSASVQKIHLTCFFCFFPSTFTFSLRKKKHCLRDRGLLTHAGRWASSQCAMWSEQELQQCSRPGWLPLPYINSNPHLPSPPLIGVNVFIEGKWRSKLDGVGGGLWQPPLQINSLFNYWEVHGFACCCGLSIRSLDKRLLKVHFMGKRVRIDGEHFSLQSFHSPVY